MKSAYFKSCLILIVSMTMSAMNDNANAQTTFTLNAGIGATIVDIEAWENYPANEVSDWNTFQSMGSIQALFLERNSFLIGIEAGYQYLFWYDVSTVYGYSLREVEAYQIMAMARRNLKNNFFTEFKTGIFSFDGFTDFSIGAAIGYHIRMNDKLAIPLKLNTTIVVDKTTNLFPVTLSSGITLSL